MGSAQALRCKECGKTYPLKKIYMCESCYAPLEVTYEYESIHLKRSSFRNRPKTMWRYRELLPVTNRSKIIDLYTGYTPLQKANRLGKTLGLN
ncbi:threonine synthase, partial [Candidatus Bathyarchaeota archaeon]|nr:threonine synthase [Candidatus Bathyarchaeota archaeon]